MILLLVYVAVPSVTVTAKAVSSVGTLHSNVGVAVDANVYVIVDGKFTSTFEFLVLIAILLTSPQVSIAFWSSAINLNCI